MLVLTLALALVGVANAASIRSEATAYEISTTTAVDYSGTSIVSAATRTSDTLFWYLACSSNCHIATGSAPVATSRSFYLPAGVLFGMPIRDNVSIAVIQDSAAGTLYVTKGLK